MGYHGDYGKYSGGIRIMMKYARLKRENGDESKIYQNDVVAKLF